VPSFLDSEVLDFSAEPPVIAPPPVTATVPLDAPLIDFLDDAPVPPMVPTDVPTSQRPVLPPIADPFDLLDGYSNVEVANISPDAGRTLCCCMYQ
jgi:hypothetical protein